jgi:bisanhydrobacterioruberin hydratase
MTLRFRIGLAVLLILHIIGAVGLLTPHRELFLSLTPVNLLLSLVLLLFGWERINLRILVSAFLVFILGWTAEYLGAVHGLVFGQYAYGPVLGYQVAEVPLLIGVNWILVMFGARALASSFGLPAGLSILMGASSAVALDWLIEPVAVHFNFWKWAADEIPFSNYAGWFGLSALLLWMLESIKAPADNRLARSLFLILFAFFGFLRMMV